MQTSGYLLLHGGDRAFANRQKLLFDKLSVAEKECNKNKPSPAYTSMDIEVDESHKPERLIRPGQKRKSETKRFSGKESIFKRPEGPAPRANIRSIPDHHRNPHKWVKYSLDDVSNDDMTDRSNTQAALSFLKELKARKMKERADKSHDKMDLDENEMDDQSSVKVVFKSRKIKTSSDVQFKKPNVNMTETENSPVIIDHHDKPMFRSSKIVMPEYVVGQKPKKKSKNEKPLVKVDHLKQLKLDHLEEFNEEEN